MLALHLRHDASDGGTVGSALHERLVREAQTLRGLLECPSPFEGLERSQRTLNSLPESRAVARSLENAEAVGEERLREVVERLGKECFPPEFGPRRP